MAGNIDESLAVKHVHQGNQRIRARGQGTRKPGRKGALQSRTPELHMLPWSPSQHQFPHPNGFESGNSRDGEVRVDLFIEQGIPLIQRIARSARPMQHGRMISPRDAPF